MDADQLAHVVQHQPARQLELRAQASADRLTGQHPVGHALAHANRPGISGLLQGTGLFQGQHHARVKLLPHPGHGGEHRGGNFAHILRDGFRVLHKVQHRAGVEREILPPHALGDVTQRQKAHAFVLVIARNQRVVAAHGIGQSAVGVHGAFGLARRPRGVDQDGHVVGSAPSHALVQRLGVLGGMLAPALAQRVQAHDHGVLQVVQALHVKNHDVAQQGQLVTHLQRLVQLLVVFDKQHRGARV